MKSKHIGKERQDSTEFSKLLEASLRGLSEMEPGSAHSVKITNIKDKSYVFIELDAKPGLIDRKEFLDAEGQITVNEGERVTAYFIENKNGELYFTTRPVGPAAQAIIEEAFEKKEPIRAESIRQIKGGYEVLLGEIRAFCPASQMATDGAEALSTEEPFLITELAGKKVVVSRRAYREQKKEEQRRLLEGKLEEGDIVSGKVVSLQNFGAFVDLGGIEALIPVAEIAFHRVAHPSEELRLGDEVRAKVLSIDWKEDRISLSRKALLENPWQGKLPFAVGEVVTGTVDSIKNFGIFVNLSDNFTGLVPLSESGVPRGQNPQGRFEKGQELRVMVVQIDRERERISLSVTRVAEADTRREYEAYMQSSDGSSEEGVSSFGKQLLAAMNKKK